VIWIVGFYGVLAFFWGLDVARLRVDWARVREFARQCFDALGHYMAGPHL
jgi:hypothetical protein